MDEEVEEVEGEVEVGEDFDDDVGDVIARVVAVLSIGCVVVVVDDDVGDDDDEVGANCSFSTNAPDLEIVVCFSCCCSSSLIDIRLLLKASLTPKTCSLFPLQ